MTFSIAARCAETGMFGLAVSSSSPAVAARCAFARAGVGAVASQNITDPALGERCLDLMAAGSSARLAIDTIVAERFLAFAGVLRAFLAIPGVIIRHTRGSVRVMGAYIGRFSGCKHVNV